MTSCSAAHLTSQPADKAVRAKHEGSPANEHHSASRCLELFFKWICRFRRFVRTLELVLSSRNSMVPFTCCSIRARLGVHQGSSKDSYGTCSPSFPPFPPPHTYASSASFPFSWVSSGRRFRPPTKNMCIHEFMTCTHWRAFTRPFVHFNTFGQQPLGSVPAMPGATARGRRPPPRPPPARPPRARAGPCCSRSRGPRPPRW